MERIKILKYDGENKELFIRVTVDRLLDKDAQLIVPATHCALLVKDGRIMEVLEPGKYEVYDKKKTLFKFFSDVEKADSVEIIYMSRTAKLPMKWGTPQQIDSRDPITDVPIRIGASGEVEVQVGNPLQFYQCIVGMDRNYSLDNLQERLLNRMMNEFKPALARTMREKNLSYNMVDEYTKEIGDTIEPMISEVLENEYGVKVFKFFINGIIIPPQCKQQIEAIISERKAEEKIKQRKAEEKAELREELNELERLKNKEWEREQYLRRLEMENYERYLSVCKIIGWDGKKSPSAGGKHCANCGEAYPAGAQFCIGCGARVAPPPKPTCPDCGKENPSGAKFCFGCGKKLI